MTKIFITGATGFIGTHVTKELLSNGYQLSALSRSDASSQKLRNLGIKPVNGTIEDPNSWRHAVAEADGVIHLAFGISSDLKEVCEIDFKVLEVIGQVYENTEKFIVYTSDLMLLGVRDTDSKDLPDEKSRHDLSAFQGTLLADYERRGETEDYVLGLSSHGIRSISIRLPPLVHGEGDHKGFLPSLFALGKQNGAVGYAGDGLNRWPTVNVKDAAVLFRLAVEKGVAGGVYHAVGEEGVSTKDISQAVARRLGFPAKSTAEEPDVLVPKEIISSLIYFLQFIWGLSFVVSSEEAKSVLGWKSTYPSIIEDIETVYK